MDIDKIHQSEEFKSILHVNCMEMVNELHYNQTQIMEMYKQNPTFPSDFYNLSLREIDTKIQVIRELYRRIIHEELS
ncbi:MAG TPA: hypothetical protein VEU72_06815 [Nitrosopumilaceae archaeon]|nr:hypothetical protein [Nitrosopumilaceae archaeon]